MVSVTLGIGWHYTDHGSEWISNLIRPSHSSPLGLPGSEWISCPKHSFVRKKIVLPISGDKTVIPSSMAGGVFRAGRWIRSCLTTCLTTSYNSVHGVVGRSYLFGDRTSALTFLVGGEDVGDGSLG